MENATAAMVAEDSPTQSARIQKLAGELRARGQVKGRALEVLRGFSESLFHELTEVLDALRAEGIDVGDKPSMRLISDGLQSLAFEWEGWRAIVSPVALALPPASESSAANAINGWCGRIIVFLQPRAVQDTADAVYEIFVSPQGWYVAEGLGLPSRGPIDHVHVQALAVAILEHLTFDIRRWHRALDRTTFDVVSQGARDPIGFVVKKAKT